MFNDTKGVRPLMATRLHPSTQRTLNPNFCSVPTLVANVGIAGLTLDAGPTIITADLTSPYPTSSLHVRPVTTFRATIHLMVRKYFTTENYFAPLQLSILELRI
ncbi:unnamed protein product [Orchesella dallaii]|uniref:Uncharacterized protein n=1 Tax=Orchesella dallaii TaxID=48710 RepID=A0ABP1QZ06_9HEXA